MIFKNIEIHNVAELIECSDGGVTWYRMPKKAFDDIETDEGRNTLCNTTGVELRFVMNSPTATIKMQSLDSKSPHVSFVLYRGGIQGGWDAYELKQESDICEIVVKKANKIESLKKVSKDLGTSFDPEVIRIIFNPGKVKILDVLGDVEPPKAEQLPKKTLLTYGSSITHGSLALAMPNTWSYLLSNRFDCDIINLGMAGYCRMEPEVIEFIASSGEQGRWDYATLELGINVLPWQEEKIYLRVTNAVRQVAGRNPEKPVFVISPFYCNSDYFGGELAKKWRKIIKEICEKENFKNVTYICGSDILDNVSLLTADFVHPNIYGVNVIAERLGDTIAENLSK